LLRLPAAAHRDGWRPLAKVHLMIVGTAGHIDHGKTTLVRALTGVDTDRLPEEKQRGISIELGYAFLDSSGGAERIGFIDVPGHERLVHTMLAGATGIDYALLLVAADDGVMPQTREHLAVLSLLGLRRGAVVLTKCDRADPAVARAQVAALLSDTPLAGAPVLEVSAHSGQGLDGLKALLQQAAHDSPPRRGAQAAFRLAVDRAFTLDGVGTVATGTVHAGQLQVGDTVVLAPGEQRARVRSLHAQNRPVQQAHAGQRCAVALVGVATDQVPRGSWLVAPAAALSAQRVDVQLTLWPGEPRALRSGTQVHVHLGACAVQGHVALLDADTLIPGASGRAQLVLQQPVGAWVGDRVVLRDASATRTMAGGTVLDPFGPVRYRRTPQRLAELDALAGLAPPASAPALAELLARSPLGVDLRRLAAACGAVDIPTAGDLPDDLLRGGDWALHGLHHQALSAQVLEVLARFHTEHPEELGPDAARLRRLAAPRLPEPLWRALLAGLHAQQAVVVRGAFVHLPAHGVRLSASEERIAQRVAPLLTQAGFEGAWARDLARDTQESEPLMRTTLARLAQRGELHQVVRDLHYPLDSMARLAALARAVAAAHEGEVTAAHFRDATGLGRKRAIQILEYLDRVGLLRRVGDVHKLRTDCNVFDTAQAVH
jgi:selenocysteine-specific elongation factor